jgi:Excreted virulence factor EspC, type VII ESX diderm
MPAVDHIDVAPADLVAHSSALEGIASEVVTAGRAGDAVQLGADAYGKLCGIVPVLLNGLSGRLVDGIDSAAQSLRDTGQRLRTAADRYETTDQQSAAAHNRIRDAL